MIQDKITPPPPCSFLSLSFFFHFLTRSYPWRDGGQPRAPCHHQTMVSGGSICHSLRKIMYNDQHALFHCSPREELFLAAYASPATERSMLYKTCVNRRAADRNDIGMTTLCPHNSHAQCALLVRGLQGSHASKQSV